jgi:hypothetical protein
MQPIKVNLAEREYEIRPLPMRPARAFREKIGAQIGGLANVLKDLDAIEVTNLSSIGDLVNQLGGTLAGSMDLIADLLFDYSPELQADRKRIEAQAYDDEIVKAFLEVLKLLYPFGALASSLNGRVGQRITTSSPSASGDAGQTS